MVAWVKEIGKEGNKVLVVDDFMDGPYQLIEQASAMAPFAAETAHYYPGVRRLITASDSATDLHVAEALQALAPLMGQVFGFAAFSPTEASFCMVTKRPEELGPLQRLPHYDHVDPNFYAVLHFLSPKPLGGTSFYRHRATGFERIGPERAAAYAAARSRESAEPPQKFFGDSTDEFERIAYFEGSFNRVLIYKGSMLHSGFIPDVFSFSADPAIGRLTCNIFIQAQ